MPRAYDRLLNSEQCLRERESAMQRWRYHSMIIRDLSIAESKLNSEGEKGWELISVCLMDGNSARAFFKMAVDEGEAPRAEPMPEMAVIGQNPFG